MHKSVTGAERVLASLDIGTNSTLFLIAKVDELGRIYPVHHDVRTNDLGRGLGEDGRLSEETIEHNVALLRDFKKIADSRYATEIHVAATEALRKAENAQILIDRAWDQLGIKINVISGQEEAVLTYFGILSGLQDQSKRIIAADIGGGSSEIILGQGIEILFSTSLPVGAVSLDKLFLKHDPPLPDEIDRVRSATKKAVAMLPEELLGKGCDLIICGGTASSLAAANLKLAAYQPEKIAGHLMTRRRIHDFIDQFSAIPVEERRGIVGIGKRRAEIILPGTILIDSLLEVLNRQQYRTSERGLRYGLLVNSGKAHNFT